MRTRLLQRIAGAIPLFAPFLVGFAFLFRDALFRGHFVLIGDPLRQLYPLRMIAWGMVRDGIPPLWTPHILSGHPLSAMVMLGMSYPLTWGYLILPGPWAEQLYILAPYILGPLLTYAFLRELGRTSVASLLGALTFAYGGFMFSGIGLTGVHANSAQWLPLVLLGVARGRRCSLVPSLLIATAGFTLAIAAGSGQLFLFGGGVSVAFGAWSSCVGTATAGRRWQPLLISVMSILLAAGLMAFQIAETWVAANESVRRDYPPGRVAEGSFPPVFAFRSLIQPLGNFNDSSTFVPLVSLFLASIAVAAAVRGRRASDEAFLWGAIALLAWLLVLGSHGPLFEVYTRLPFVGRFRYPSRHTFEWSFAVGALAASGWDWVQSRWSRAAAWRLAVPVGMGFSGGAVFVAYAWGRFIVAHSLDGIESLNFTSHGVSGGYVAHKIAFSGLALGALFTFSKLQDSLRSRLLLASAVTLACLTEPHLWLGRPAISAMSMTADKFTAVATSTRIILARMDGETAGFRERVFSALHPYGVPSPGGEIESANWTALAGFHEVNGYESLIPERYSAAFHGYVNPEPYIDPDTQLLRPGSHVLDLLNVRYVTAFKHFGRVAPARTSARSSEPLQLSPLRWSVLHQRNDIMILENLRTLPRAWLVPRVDVYPAEKILRMIRGECATIFDPRRVALVEPGTRAASLSGEPLPADAFARITRFEPNKVSIETNSSRSAYLVVSELYHPGWIATIDGAHAPIDRANYLLRGLTLPAGRHLIEMQYTAPAARKGAVVSAVSLATLIALFIGHRRHRRRTMSS